MKHALFLGLALLLGGVTAQHAQAAPRQVVWSDKGDYLVQIEVRSKSVRIRVFDEDGDPIRLQRLTGRVKLQMVRGASKQTRNGVVKYVPVNKKTGKGGYLEVSHRLGKRGVLTVSGTLHGRQLGRRQKLRFTTEPKTSGRR